MRRLLDSDPLVPEGEEGGDVFIDPLEAEGGDLGNQPINDPSN